MAGIAMILGATFGFLLAVFGFFVLDFSVLTALSIWALSGPATAVPLMLRAALRSSADPHAGKAMSAETA